MRRRLRRRHTRNAEGLTECAGPNLLESRHHLVRQARHPREGKGRGDLPGLVSAGAHYRLFLAPEVAGVLGCGLDRGEVDPGAGCVDLKGHFAGVDEGPEGPPRLLEGLRRWNPVSGRHADQRPSDCSHVAIEAPSTLLEHRPSIGGDETDGVATRRQPQIGIVGP